MVVSRGRQLIVLRGTREETWEAARGLLARAPFSRHVIISDDAHERSLGALRANDSDVVLGDTVGVAVVDAHGGLDPQTLGRVYGAVDGGGALVLRFDADTTRPITTDLLTRRRLAAWPFGPEDVGDRWFKRFVALAGEQATTAAADFVAPSATRALETHPEQSALVETLVSMLRASGPARAIILAPRGRGKSAAIGMALRQIAFGRIAAGGGPGTRVRIASADVEARDEIGAFLGDLPATEASCWQVDRVSAQALARPGETQSRHVDQIVVVDEAAKVPLPVLKAIVLANAGAKLVFATTTDGYEGTGQGFVLRFKTWLLAQAVPCASLELNAPIRWSADDRVEPFVYKSLLLDASPAQAADFGQEPSSDDAHWSLVDRDALCADEARLGDIFGLLRHAHYRTTPRDLEAMLDAPNMHLHVLTLNTHIAAVCLVADEGRLTAEDCAAATAGRRRLLAHAIPDSLCAHMGMRDAGRLHYVRSVRIATHPALRRLGLAGKLVEAVHAHHRPDVFGTLFGATAELVAFRRKLGYEVVRVSASRGARTGEPSVLMLRAVSQAGEATFQEARRLFETSWPFQQQWVFGSDVMAPEAAVIATLNADVVTKADLVPLSRAELEAQITTYLNGPQTFEQASRGIATLAERAPEALTQIPPDLEALLRARVLGRESWDASAAAARMAHAGVAMKAMRKAVAALADAAGLALDDRPD